MYSKILHIKYVYLINFQYSIISKKILAIRMKKSKDVSKNKDYLR